MQNICKSVHLDFNDTGMSNDDLEDDLSNIFGFGDDSSSSISFPDFTNVSFHDSFNDSFNSMQDNVEIHIGRHKFDDPVPTYDVGTMITHH